MPKHQLVSTWTKRVVHCVFDDKDKNTKTLAANDRSPVQKINFICKTICDVGGVVRWYLACTSHDRLGCHLTDYVGKVVMPGC